MFHPNGEANPEVTTRDISIKLKDVDDNSLSGFTVSIGDESRVTGSAGGCTLRGISDGEHSVLITDDQSSWTESITVDSENTSFTFILTSENTP